MSDIFSNAGNPYLNEISKPVSLLDLKIERLRNNVAAKQEKLQPTRTEEDIVASFDNLEGDSGDSLFNLAKSSVYRSKENIGNFLSGDSNPNRQADSDLKAGYTGREVLNNKQNEIIQGLAQSRVNFSEGNTLKGLADLGSAAFNTAKIAPELAADSAGSLVEGAVGVGLTFLPEAASSIAGVGLLSKKAKQGKDTVESIGDAIKKAEAAIKSGKKPNVLQKALVKSVRASSQTSLMTASVLQEMKEDYIQENGESPSAEYYAVNAPIAVALNTVQLGIFKKLFLPTKSGVKADIEGIKKYAKEMKDVLDNVPKSYSKQVAKKVLSTAKDVSIAAGAEAGQEYLQTWHEILATKMDNLSLDEAVKELSQGSNQDQALFGLLAGGAAGGVTKGALKVPSLAGGVVGSTASSVASTVADKTKSSALNKSYKLLSESEKEEVEKDYERNKDIYNQFSNVKNSQIDELKKAKSFNDLKDEEVIAEVTKVASGLGVDKNNKEVFGEVAEAVQNKYRAAIQESAKNLEKSNAGRVVKGNVNTLKDKVKTAVSKENYDKAIEIAKGIGSSSVDLVNKIKSSEALQVIEKGIDFARDSGKDKAKELKALAESSSLEDLKAATKVLKSKNEYVSNLLDKVINRKEKALSSFKGKQSLIKESNLSPAIKSVIKAGKFTKSSFSVISTEILKAGNSRIEDIKSAEQVQKVIKMYEDSQFNKSDDKLKLTKKELSKIKDKIANRIKELKDQAATEDNKESLKEKFEKGKDKVLSGARQLKAEELQNKIEKMDKKFLSFDSEEERVLYGNSILEAFGVSEDPKIKENNLILDIIKSGIVTKEDFESYMKKHIPNFSGIVKSDKTYLQFLSDKIYDVELRKYNETAKNEKKKETEQKTEEKVESKEELKAKLKDYEIEADHYVNDDDIAIKKLDDADLDRLTKIAEDLGNKNMICGIN